MAGHGSRSNFIGGRRGRLFTALVGVVVVALLGAACGGGDDDAGSGGNGTGPDKGTPVEGGTLRVGMTAEPTTLDPSKVTQRQFQSMQRLIVENLMERDAQTLKPTTTGLVTAVEQTAPDTFELTVREGVEFHNGEVFDAAAAARSIELAKGEGIVLSAFYQYIASAEALDATTVEVKTETPQRQSWVETTLTETRVYPPEYFDEVGGYDGFGESPVGTGPFSFVAWEKGISIELARNDSYWDGAPKLEGIVFSFNPDPASRLAAIEAGDSDVTVEVPPSLLPVDSSSVEVVSERSVLNVVLEFQGYEAPVDDVRIRQAVAHAIDREAITGSILRGDLGGVPSDDIFAGAEGIYEDLPASPYQYDVDAAKALLADYEAEHGSVPTLTFTPRASGFPAAKDVAEAITGQLQAVGFDVDLNPQEPGAFFEAYLPGELNGLVMTLAGAYVPDPRHFFLSQSSTQANRVSNCQDPAFDDLMEEYDTSGADVDSDAILDELQTAQRDEMVCMIGLYDIVDSVVAGKDVGGVSVRRDSWVPYDEMWLAS